MLAGFDNTSAIYGIECSLDSAKEHAKTYLEHVLWLRMRWRRHLRRLFLSAPQKPDPLISEQGSVYPLMMMLMMVSMTVSVSLLYARQDEVLCGGF